MTTAENTALKEIFDARQFRTVARDVAKVYRGFDAERFLDIALAGLDPLSLMQRLRRMSQALHGRFPRITGGPSKLFAHSRRASNMDS